MQARLLLFLLAAAPAFAAPGKTCDPRTFGAKADGTTKDTAALQSAIDACSDPHAGTVTLTGNAVFLSGPLVLRSGVTLQIESGTTLAASADHDDFKPIEEFREHGREPLLSSDHAENITLTGGGTIDGRGESWWNNRPAGDSRPRLVVFRYSHHILMQDLTVENSPSWQIVPYYSDDLTFRRLKILAPDRVSHNTDGIDPFSSGHVLIDHVLIDTGDDDIAIKSGQPNSPGPDAPSHDITVTDCTLLHGHGLSVGSETAGGVQNLRVERVHFKGTHTGIRIKSNRDRGADIGNFVYRDLTMEDVPTPILITSYYPKVPASIAAAPVTRLTPHFHNIAISNLTATGATEGPILIGLPEAPIQGLELRDVHITATKPGHASYVDVTSKDLTIQVPGTTQPMVIGEGVRGNLP